MDGNYLTAGDLALWEQRRSPYEGYGERKRSSHATATTGVALAAGLGGGALLLAIAGLWGVNNASKARSEGAASTISQYAKSQSDLINILATRFVSDNQRMDNITLDINNKLFSLQGASATGGSASSSALATAEALALLNGSNNPLSSAIQNSCALRVQRVSTQDCGCGCS